MNVINAGVIILKVFFQNNPTLINYKNAIGNQIPTAHVKEPDGTGKKIVDTSAPIYLYVCVVIDIFLCVSVCLCWRSMPAYQCVIYSDR